MFLLTCCIVVTSFIVVTVCHERSASWDTAYSYDPPIPQDIMVNFINNLGLCLLQAHNQNNPNNIALSPYGTASVLIALGEGVQGSAVQELQTAAQIPNDISIIRVGLRDIHRHLKSYFIPKEGFLAGLTFSHENFTLNPDYEKILRFYGYDVDSFNNPLYPDPGSTTGTPTNTENKTDQEGSTTEVIGSYTMPPVGSTTSMDGVTIIVPSTIINRESEAGDTTDTTLDSTTEPNAKPTPIVITVMPTLRGTGMENPTESTSQRQSTSTLESTTVEDGKPTPIVVDVMPTIRGTTNEAEKLTDDKISREETESLVETITNSGSNLELTTTRSENLISYNTKDEKLSGTSTPPDSVSNVTVLPEDSTTNKPTTLDETSFLTTIIPSALATTVLLPNPSIKPIAGLILKSNANVAKNNEEQFTTTDTYVTGVTSSVSFRTSATSNTLVPESSTIDTAVEIITQNLENNNQNILQKLIDVTTNGTASSILGQQNEIFTSTEYSDDYFSSSSQYEDEGVYFENYNNVVSAEKSYNNERSAETSTNLFEIIDQTISNESTGKESTTNHVNSDSPLWNSITIEEVTELGSTTARYIKIFNSTATGDINQYQRSNNSVTQNTSKDTTLHLLKAQQENNNAAQPRITRSVIDYVIAKHYDHYPAKHEETPSYEPDIPLTFLVDGKVREPNINFMTYDTVLPFSYDEMLHAVSLQFPLDSTKYYLLLILPTDGQDIDELICNIKENTNLHRIVSRLRQTHVKATIPSFMLKGYVVLTPTLQKLGILKIFEPRRADFSPMTNETGIYVTNIEQAVTVTIRNYVDSNSSPQNSNLYRMPPVRFTADRPFLYFVMDSEIHVALMAGKIINPLNSRIR